MPFEDEADAVRLANDTDFGLVAAVWTRDGDCQARLARRVQSGQFFINCYGAGGGGYTMPIGAYIGDTLGVRFQANPVALLAVGIPFAYVTGKALTSVIKALKK